ncbi:hypothetical protein B0O99DRAFT_685059 [Bisporella sp. PMI_857]|nr:hypothetical protein B0O99DRAFT_685059 [Bisporella sp. PMI_857]
MRGLKAAVVLAPVASAFILPGQPYDEKHDTQAGRVADHSTAIVTLDVQGDQSADEWAGQQLGLRLEVFSSPEACGQANIVIEGQKLALEQRNDVLAGSGEIATQSEKIVVASWEVTCIKANGEQDSQFLKFSVKAVDGMKVGDIGFSTLFRQNGQTEILRLTEDLLTPDIIASRPVPTFRPIHGEAPSPVNSLEHEFAELDWLIAQMHELEFLIAEKHQAIAEHASRHFPDDIKDCDSLKCVLSGVAQKAKNAAHHVYGKLAGEHGPDGDRPDHPHFPFPGKDKFPSKHGNHTHGPPNGTHPAPPHRRPHHFLPICRFPPPPHHRGHHGPPPPHGEPGRHHPPPHFPPHDGPEFDGPPPPHHGQDHFHDGPDDDRRPPPPHFGGHPPHHPPPDDFPPPHHEDGPHFPPPPHGESSSLRSDGNAPPPPPPGMFGGRPPHHHGPPYGRAFHILKFTIIGFLCAFLLLALHRRACTPSRKAARKARREERRHRRRIAHKNAITRLLAKMGGNNASDDEASSDYEEKRTALLSDMEDGLSTTMSEEIHQLQNAASVVDDMVNAEEGRSREQLTYQPAQQAPTHAHALAIPVHDSAPMMRDYETASQACDEELPAYEDSDDSDSLIADGLRYTPGSSDYSPSQSSHGSVDDILGPDTKQ